MRRRRIVKRKGGEDRGVRADTGRGGDCRAGNDGRGEGQGVSSSLEVSKNLKFSYSSRAADGLRMPRMWDRSGGRGRRVWVSATTLAGQGFSKFSLVNGHVNPFRVTFTRIFRAVSFFLLFKSKLQVNSRKENLFSVESFDNKKSRGASGFGNLNSWNYSSKIWFGSLGWCFWGD